MGKIASSHCKKIYVTDDNPRNEKPEKIRNEIIKNINNKNTFNIGNRTKAIKTAIQNAAPNEIILIAVKDTSKNKFIKKIIIISDKRIVKQMRLKIKKIDKKNKIFAK